MKGSSLNKKNNKVIQIVQNQCINLKTPDSTELVFNWPLKTNNTVKNEFAKRVMNDSRLGFARDRQASIESKGKYKNKTFGKQKGSH